MNAATNLTSPGPAVVLRRATACLAGILVALAVLSSPAASAATPAKSADSFVDSIGVNTHTYWSDTIYYSRFSQWKAKLADLGVRHIRENLVTNRPDQYQRLNELAAAGVKSTLIMGDPTEGTAGLEKLVAIARDKIRGSLAALEGTNEFDLSGRANWRNELAAYHQRLSQLVGSDPSLSQLPLIGPSIVHWDSMDELGDISGQLDYGNIHSYPDGYQPESNLSSHLGHVAANSAAKPVMATETGYHTALGWTKDHKPANEATQATYVPRMFLEYFRRGVARTFSYELLDQAAGSNDREDNFGLLRNDLSEKPAFAALRNTISILEDPGTPFAAGSLEYSLSGAPSDLRQVLLQKRDGSFYLALWRASSVWDPVKRVALSPSSAQVSVKVGAKLAGAERYAPNSSAAAVGSYADPNGPLSVSVGPQVTILRLTPGSEAPANPPQTPTPPAEQEPLPEVPAEEPPAEEQAEEEPPEEEPPAEEQPADEQPATPEEAAPAAIQGKPATTPSRGEHRSAQKAKRTAQRSRAKAKAAKRSRRTTLRTRTAKAAKRDLKRDLQRH